ncbi:hypothetical protein Dimus_038673 [Dionaea muscipula]
MDVRASISAFELATARDSKFVKFDIFVLSSRRFHSTDIGVTVSLCFSSTSWIRIPRIFTRSPFPVQDEDREGKIIPDGYRDGFRIQRSGTKIPLPDPKSDRYPSLLGWCIREGRLHMGGAYCQTIILHHLQNKRYEERDVYKTNTSQTVM